jgi:CheY-like chemotaxis protein
VNATGRNTRALCPESTRNLTAKTMSLKRILVVDDDPAGRDAFHELLVAAGFFVLPAENGKQALELAANAKVDLALLDLIVPIENGWATFEQLARAHPLLSIIIVTAFPNQLFTAASAGAAALLEKPVGLPTLLPTLAALLAETSEQRRARRAGQQADFHYTPATTRASRSEDRVGRGDGRAGQWREQTGRPAAPSSSRGQRAVEHMAAARSLLAAGGGPPRGGRVSPHSARPVPRIIFAS